MSWENCIFEGWLDGFPPLKNFICRKACIQTVLHPWHPSSSKLKHTIQSRNLKHFGMRTRMMLHNNCLLGHSLDTTCCYGQLSRVERWADLLLSVRQCYMLTADNPQTDFPRQPSLNFRWPAITWVIPYVYPHLLSYAFGWCTWWSLASRKIKL